MLNLTLSILAILIVAGLALVSVFYGGSIMKDSGRDTAVAQYITSGTQIVAAIDLFRIHNDGNLPQDLETLLDQDYLSATPQGGWAFEGSKGRIIAPAVNDDFCKAVNEHLTGIAEIPPCIEVKSRIACCND